MTESHLHCPCVKNTHAILLTWRQWCLICECVFVCQRLWEPQLPLKNGLGFYCINDNNINVFSGIKLVVDPMSNIIVFGLKCRKWTFKLYIIDLTSDNLETTNFRYGLWIFQFACHVINMPQSIEQNFEIQLNHFLGFWMWKNYLNFEFHNGSFNNFLDIKKEKQKQKTLDANELNMLTADNSNYQLQYYVTYILWENWTKLNYPSCILMFHPEQFCKYNGKYHLRMLSV